VLVISGDEVESVFACCSQKDVQKKLEGYQPTEHGSFLTFADIVGLKKLPSNVKFDPENWKASRQFIKDSISKFALMTSTVIIEDDFLLGSLRKYYRSFCAHNKYRFA